jgi:hypothetical protein
MATTESSSQNKEQLYDPLRQQWVAATPEERVRQRLLQKMVEALSYPKELLSVERALKDLCLVRTEAPNRRVDIICFAKTKDFGMTPLLVIECKESEELAKKALSQVQGYNAFLQAPFLAVAYPRGETFVYMQEDKEKYLSYLPSYPMLLEAVGYG